MDRQLPEPATSRSRPSHHGAEESGSIRDVAIGESNLLIASIDHGMSIPLDDIEFLAASENRVRVLTYLRETAASRQELHEETGVSRSTLSRCLSGLHDRGWITQSGSRCEITPLGRFFVDEFTELLRMAEGIRTLRDLETSLPIAEMDIDPRRFADATVTVVTRADPTAPMRRVKRLIRRAGHVRLTTGLFEGPLVEVLWDQTVHGDLTALVVVSDGVIETVRDNAEMARMLRETLRTEQVEFLRSDGVVPHIVVLVDDSRGCVLVRDDDGVVRGELDTDDAAFRSWVASTIEEQRRDATPVPTDAFTV